MRFPATLTPSEIEILRETRNDPNIFADYFFKPVGEEHGWMFDANFDPEGAWQKNLVVAEQKDITVIGGFGTGKTSGVGMGACLWAVTLRDFKFLNVAPNAWQAKLMYDQILTNVNGTRFNDLIWEKPRRPHPKLVIKFYIGKILYESTLEFMSADKDATGILSWEGDWLHVDEAGLIDNLEMVIINAGSRLRGSVRGRTRLGRFSMASNSWDNYQLWYYFDLASGDPQNFLSMMVSSRHNHNVTEEQLARMVARIPVEERERFIEGSRPEGRGWYFAKEKIYECEDQYFGEYIENSALTGKPGYVYEKLYGAGVVRFRIPPKPGSMYMLFGDPGIGAAPQRNAPCLMLWNVDMFPKVPARLVAFWWGNGYNRIAPFIDEMFKLIEIYRPVFTGIDSTGPQKNMHYLINEHLFKESFYYYDTTNNVQTGYLSPYGYISGIGAMDFSGNMKNTYLISARLMIESHLLAWPKSVIGIRSQLSNYDPEKDKKIAQDIVATIGMSCYGIRTFFHITPEEMSTRGSAVVTTPSEASRRSSNVARNKRTWRGTRPPKRSAYT